MNTKLLIVCMTGAAALLLLRGDDGPVSDGADTDTQDEGILDAAKTVMDEVFGVVSIEGQVEYMKTSQNMIDMLKRRESLSLTPYNLGDGGWTIGYGHFERLRSSLPDSITRSEAEAMFSRDVADRGEKWVKLYVKVPLTQNQFDALVSIAFNMSPQSFKKFANAVNAGDGIDYIAQQSVSWVSAKFTNGIRNRRNAEVAVFNYGAYA